MTKVIMTVDDSKTIRELVSRMDGVTLIRKLRADPRFRATPILMLTTESDSAKKAEGKSAGATGWLVKPFDPKKLLDVVAKVLP